MLFRSRVLKNETTARYEADPSLLRPFPEQLMNSFRDGTFHLGGDASTLGVDPAREGYPAGQAVGAITSIESAGDVVAKMMAEANAVVNRLNSKS